MLNLYRRHGRKCSGNHSEGERSTEGQERSKKWKGCYCPISASGTLAGKFDRKNLGVADWEMARKMAATAEAAGTWDTTVAQALPPEPSAPATPDDRGKRLDEAIREFLAFHEKHSAPATTRNYRCFLGALQKFADAKSLLGVREFGPVLIRDWRDSWTVKRSTMVKNMATLKTFFAFCLESQWIEQNPARIRSPKGGDKTDTQKLPFSDSELQRMLDACENLYGKQPIKWDRDVHHCPAVHTTNQYTRQWTGEDLADFIYLSVHTGLRISDIVLFNVDRIDAKGICRVRAKKNGAWVYTKLAGWLVERIMARAERVGPMIFGESKAVSLDHKTNLWRQRLNDLWALCGPWEATPTPHRFRHTFARYHLEKGTPVALLADLMGDTEATVRRSYSAWVPERQESLTAAAEKIAEHMPRPKELGTVVEMPVRKTA